jgi:hypothetical protein
VNYPQLPNKNSTKWSTLNLNRKFIQLQIQNASHIKNHNLEKSINENIEDTISFKKDLKVLKGLEKRDMNVIEKMKKEMNVILRNSDLIERYVSTYESKTGNNDQYAEYLFLIRYFENFTTLLETRMALCRQNIEVLEINKRNWKLISRVLMWILLRRLLKI